MYNNEPFIMPIVLNNVLAMFWRSKIESKYMRYPLPSNQIRRKFYFWQKHQI